MHTDSDFHLKFIAMPGDIDMSPNYIRMTFHSQISQAFSQKLESLTYNKQDNVCHS